MALQFGAPWSRSLKAASLIAVVMLAVVAAAGMFVMPARLLLARCVMIGLPIIVLAIAFLSIVSGYTLTATQLEVERPLWNTVFPLAQLRSVAGDQNVFKGSLRLFGNGGIFSFTGFFWKRSLGCYRAFATDPGRAVVLKFCNRTIVITPHDPQHFIVRVRTHLASAIPSIMNEREPPPGAVGRIPSRKA
ncbi:MAG TPA: PH domain-containing protein [Steroidobacteraceae bacterium]